MPTYEYRCQDCAHEFEVFHSIKADPVATCPICSGHVTRLLSGGAGLIFKGSGFYITDYKNKKPDSPEKKDAKPDTSSSSGSNAESSADGKKDKDKKDKGEKDK